MTLVGDLDRREGRVEHFPAPPVAPIEPDRVTTVQLMHRRRERTVLERREQVVVRRHQAEAVATERSRDRQLSDDLHSCVVVAVVAEDVLLGVGARGDVEQAGVCRTRHRLIVAIEVKRVCDARAPTW
jgi:hypothetical protein